MIGLGDTKRMVSSMLWIVDSKSGSPPGILFLDGPATGVSSSVILVTMISASSAGVSVTGACVSSGCDSSLC